MAATLVDPARPEDLIIAWRRDYATGQMKPLAYALSRVEESFDAATGIYQALRHVGAANIDTPEVAAVLGEAHVAVVLERDALVLEKVQTQAAHAAQLQALEQSSDAALEEQARVSAEDKTAALDAAAADKATALSAAAEDKRAALETAATAAALDKAAALAARDEAHATALEAARQALEVAQQALETLQARYDELLNQPPARTLSPFEFTTRFEIGERITLREAAKLNPVVEDFMDLMNRVPRVELDAPMTQSGIAYLVQQSLLTAERAAEILA